MNPYLAVPLLVVVSLLQSTLSPRLQIGAVWPDFLLLMVMSWALARRPNEASMWSLVGGIAVDLASGGPFGGTVIGLLVVAQIATLMADGAFRGRAVLPVVTAFVATIAFHGAYLLAMLLVGQGVDGLDALLRIVLPSAVYNGALSLIVYGLMSAIDRRIRPKALRW